MPNGSDDDARLKELLRAPSEDLETEFKGWLDLTNKEDRACLAKPLMAMANHGGGEVIIGFDDGGPVLEPDAANRPKTLRGYTADVVNGIVHKYAEPPFHCNVRMVENPNTGLEHPVILVPGGHDVPIRAKRSGPGGVHVKQDAYYIRRPGPASEPPTGGAEWRDLISRCVRNNRQEMLDALRDVLLGRVLEDRAPEKTSSVLLAEWVDTSLAEMKSVVASRLSIGTEELFEHGYWTISYRLETLEHKPEYSELMQAVRAAEVRHTGWPLFVVIDRDPLTPYLTSEGIEAFLAEPASSGPANVTRDPAHADFWRVTPEGLAFSLRGYPEDSGRGRIRPGEMFDIVIPIWRIGEGLLHAQRLAEELGDPDGSVAFRVDYYGLKGRRTGALDGRRHVRPRLNRGADHAKSEIRVEIARISDLLPELVVELLTPVYQTFEFMSPSIDLATEELKRMRESRRS